MADKLEFTKLKYLVIDDFPEFRSTVKKMVEAFGGTKIDTSGNGEDANEKMSRTRYDVVLSDYNLGDGKDGQQVLEEAKHKGYLKNSCIYVMLTAESTMKMVMGALEYEPDGYLTKPFNKDMLAKRLEKIHEKKGGLFEIHNAIDKRQIDKALALCDEQIAARSKIMLDCLKIKGKLLLEDAQFAKARDIYQQVIKVRELPWALLGLGKSLYYLEEYYDASSALQDLIDLNEMFVEAYDWLAKCKLKLGDPIDAQKTLQEAVRLSPKSILRQRALGEMASLNKDVAVSEKALRQAVKLGKHSVYNTPDISLDFAKTLVEKNKINESLAGKRAGTEALQVIKDLAKKHSGDMVVTARSAIVESTAYSGLKKDAEAKKTIIRAEKCYKALGDAPPAGVSIEMAEALFTVGEKEKGQELARTIVKDFHEDEALSDRIKDMAEFVGIDAESGDLIASEKEKLKEINSKGMDYFEQGKYEEAVELFEQAVEEMPNNVSVSLNAVQALVKYMEEKGKDNAMLNRSRKYLESIKDIDVSDKRYARYIELSKMHESIAKS